jgi:hypothetical protein
VTSEETPTPDHANEATPPTSERAGDSLSWLGPVGRRWTRYGDDKKAFKEEEQRWKEQDKKDNAQDRLPDDEDVQIAAVWVTELYPPSAVDALIDGLQKLSWGSNERKGENLASWVRESRTERYPRVRGIGIVRPGGERSRTDEYESNLPEGVLVASPLLHSLTTGLTALTVMFAFKEASAKELGNLLRNDYASFISRLPPKTAGTRRLRTIWRKYGPPWWGSYSYGYSIVFSEEVRRRAIATFLHDRRRASSQWVRDTLPGLFSSDPDNYELPSVQLLVVDKAEPFKHTPANRWLHTLDIGSPLPAYQGGPDDAFRGAPPTRLSDVRSRTFTLTLQRHGPLKLDEPKQRIERVLGLDVNASVAGFLLRRATMFQLALHRQRLTSLRDATAKTTKSRRTVRDLKAVRQQLVAESLDARIAARDVKRLAEERQVFYWGALNLRTLDPQAKQQEPEHLLERLRLSQLRESKELLDDVDLVVETLSTDSNLFSAISNIRLQRFVIVLTAISIAIAIWAALIAAGQAG